MGCDTSTHFKTTLKHNKMTILTTNKTYTNTTNKIINYKVIHKNQLGYIQETTHTLKPLQSITKTNPQNKVIIYNN